MKRLLKKRFMKKIDSFVRLGILVFVNKQQTPRRLMFVNKNEIQKPSKLPIFYMKKLFLNIFFSGRHILIISFFK